MAVSAEKLRNYLEPVFRKREFRLESLNGSIPEPLAEGIALAKIFHAGDIQELGRRVRQGLAISAELDGALIGCMQRELAGGARKLIRDIQNAFIVDEIFAVYCSAHEPGIIVNEFDVDDVPMYVLLTDSYGKRQNGGTMHLDDEGRFITVNLTTAIGRACATIQSWLELKDTERMRADDAVDGAWKALEGRPDAVIMLNAWDSIARKLNELSVKTDDAEEFTLSVISLFARSSAVHEAAHLLERKANAGRTNGVNPERYAYALQALYSDVGVTLCSAEDGTVGILFPELRDEIRRLGKGALRQGANHLKGVMRRLLDEDFGKIHGKPHHEVLDVSVLNEFSDTDLFGEEDREIVIPALHLPLY